MTSVIFLKTGEKKESWLQLGEEQKGKERSLEGKIVRWAKTSFPGFSCCFVSDKKSAMHLQAFGEWSLSGSRERMVLELKAQTGAWLSL